MRFAKALLSLIVLWGLLYFYTILIFRQLGFVVRTIFLLQIYLILLIHIFRCVANNSIFETRAKECYKA